MVWHLPPEKLSLPEDTVHVWKKQLDVSQDQQQTFHSILTLDERKRASRYLFDEPRMRYIVARGVLRQLITKYVNDPQNEITLDENAWGKPMLAADSGIHLEFNVAHSHNLALLVFSRNRSVGVDVEYIHPVDHVDHLVKHFFSEYEQHEFGNLPAAQQLLSFFTAWTRKEAYIKGRGQGLSIPLSSFDVNMQPDEPAVLIDERSDPSAMEMWSIIDIDVADGYAGALAIGGGQTECALHYYDFDRMATAHQT